MIEWLATDGVREAGLQALMIVLVKSTVLLGVLLACGALLRGAGGEARARLWAGGIVALLVLPLLSKFLPALPLSLADFPRMLFEQPVWSPAAPTASAAPHGRLDALAALPFVSWAFAVWATGALFLVLRFAVRSASIRRLARRAQACDVAGAAALDDARRRMGVRREVRLALTDRIATPLVFGWRTPTILLPSDAPTWTRSRLDAVLAHELAHVRRGDYAWLVLTELAHALYWPNPLVRIARGAFRLEQDKACDGAAVEAGVRATDYAAELLAFARVRPHRSASTALPLVGAGRVSPLGSRIRALLERRGPEGSGRRIRALTATTLLLAGSLILAAADPWICPGVQDTVVVASPAFLVD